MWSFAEPLGSHSPYTKLKTHYSEQLHCYNNTLVVVMQLQEEREALMVVDMALLVH